MSIVLIVGSVAYDGLKTPYASTPEPWRVCTYSSMLRPSTKTHIVGVVGEDFRAQDIKLL